MGGVSEVCVCAAAGIRMNAGHLVLAYMPPYFDRLYPVRLPPSTVDLIFKTAFVMGYVGSLRWRSHLRLIGLLGNINTTWNLAVQLP